MKTLLFCTAFGRDPGIWRLRFRRWFDAIKCSGIHADTILLVDDGSPVLPQWADVPVVSDAREIGDAAIFHFHQNLGRQARAIYPGWFRSFTFAGRFAASRGFEKIVHIESDAFVISPRAVAWINDLEDGWETPFCVRYKIPESAIQVMAGSGLDAFFEVSHRPYSEQVGIEAEKCLPFTRIAKELTGDRYGETTHDVPRDADWATQSQPSRKRDYWWWLPDSAVTDLL